MRIKFKNISIRSRIYFVISIFLVSAFFSILILNHYRQELSDRNESLKLSIASQYQLEELIELSNSIFLKNIYDLRDDISDTQELIDSQLSTIIHGSESISSKVKISKVTGLAAESGQVILNEWNNVKLLISPIQTLPVKIDSTFYEDIILQINDSTTHTQTVEKSVLINNPQLVEAVTQLQQAINKLNGHHKLFISHLNAQSDAIFEGFKYSFFVIGFINLIIFVPALFWLRKTVLIPLKKVGLLAKKVSQGDIDAEIDYQKEDEIGDISTAISSLANYLNNASSFVHDIGEGNLESQFEGIDINKIQEGGLAHSLISMKGKLKNMANEDRKRSWTTEGLARFAEILRKNNTKLNILGDAILAELVPYTKSNQGCVYVVEGEGDYTKLDAKAFYAFDSKKFIENTVDLGEGLVGQTFLENKTTYLVEVPEEYLVIKSGLGAMKPNAILIVPLTFNDETFGILELSTLNAYEDYQIEFVEKLAETIASAIANVKNNEQTKKLLEESQQLTEQMRSQEEEMRQNMEELSATQEEMARKEAHTTATVQALESTMLTAELDMSFAITQANANMVAGTRSNNLNNLISKSAFEIFKDNFGNEMPESFLKSIKNGESQRGIFKLKEFSVIGSFVPIKLNSDELQSILVFCQPLEGDFNLDQSDDHRIDELEEELKVNLESLQIAENALKERLNKLK